MYQVRKAGGEIAFEWPEKCKNWKWKPVKDLTEHHNSEFAYCSGCALGMKVSILNPRAKENREKYVFKPWWIASDDYELLMALNKDRCPGESPRHQHGPCAGQLTKPTKNTQTEWYALFIQRGKQAALMVDASLYRQ